MSDRGKLGNFLREVINWDWLQFLKAEKDPKYSPLQGTVFALVREASESKLGAIKLSIKRVDGQLETPVQVIFPKLFYRYPYATEVAELPAGEIPENAGNMPTPEEFEEHEDTEDDLLTFGLRETLNKMAETPDRRIVPLVIGRKAQVEQMYKSKVEIPADFGNIPLVKTVISAHLLDLAMEQNNFEAITEVFDQIDGKLVETIKIMGDDLYLDQYDEIAPPGSVKNADGIYQREQKELTEAWAQRFAANKKLSNF